MRLCDYVIEYLENIGITTVYAVTGRGALFLNDAMAKNTKIHKVFPHHEQSAVFAACAAASLTKMPQAVIVSTGCASTNAITGVLSAWQDNLPLIVISGQHLLLETTAYTGETIRTYGQQEANILPIVSSITKYSCIITEPTSLRYHLEKAYIEAVSDNPGPVWIDIPLDLQNHHIDPQQLERFNIQKSRTSIDPKEVSELYKALTGASRPVFLIGAGVDASGAADLLKEISISYDLPIVYTNSAVDIIPLSFSNTIGSLASQGASRAGAFAVQNADLVIVLGSRMNSITTGPDKEKFARDADIYAIDIDPLPHYVNGITYKQIIAGDILECLSLIKARMTKSSKSFTEWMTICKNWKTKFLPIRDFQSTEIAVDLHEFAYLLPELMGEDGILICDSGFVDVIVPTNAPFKSGQRCIRPVSQGAMGFALPAAIGVGMNSASSIFCIVGDGSIMFNLQELDTVARYNINVKICIINNNMYAVIKRRQNQLFRERIIGVDDTSGLSVPDFKTISSAFGIEYIECQPENYRKVLQDNISIKRPQIYEIPGKVDQDYLEVHHCRTAKRKFARRPLEDQKPFLARDEFLANMIIDPIDQ